MKATWSVVILFEDAQTREKAVKFCDQLVERFWAHCEFRLTWMEFSALDDPNAARHAHTKARGADVIVFATQPEGPVPPTVGSRPGRLARGAGRCLLARLRSSLRWNREELAQDARSLRVRWA